MKKYFKCLINFVVKSFDFGGNREKATQSLGESRVWVFICRESGMVNNIKMGGTFRNKEK